MTSPSLLTLTPPVGAEAGVVVLDNCRAGGGQGRDRHPAALRQVRQLLVHLGGPVCDNVRRNVRSYPIGGG